MCNSIGKARGYMTVEATIVVPIVLFSYVLMMYMLIYIYDEILLNQDTMTMAVYASEEYYRNEKEFQEKLIPRFELFKSEHPYLSAGDFGMTVEKRKSRITVKASLTFYTPIGEIVGQWFPITTREIVSEKEMTIIDPVTLMLTTEDLLR